MTDLSLVRTKPSDNLVWAGFILLHIPLALLMQGSSIISTLHALVTFIAGLKVALTARQPHRVIWFAAYICFAEVLWRMTGARVFWEFGKYALVALLVIFLLRMRAIRSTALPILFFLLLTISIPLTMQGLSLDEARQAISFNLSGPMCLAVCVLFFYQFRLRWGDRETLIWSTAGPVLAIATLCLRGISVAEQLTFSTDSNFTTSAGFGPNQVSTILGLGSLLLFLLAFQQRNTSRRWIPLGLGLGMLTLSVLTFSRGGLYNVLASLLVFSFFSFRSARLRNVLIPTGMVALVISGFVIYPRLNLFTGGMLATRFMDTSTTGRLEIAQSELDVWRQHPLMGVGPGMGPYFARDIYGRMVAAHTEYTRLLAEHGLPGVMAIVLLLIMAGRAVMKAPSGFPQAWVAALLVWSLVDMTHAAMRLAVVGFIFGLAVAGWQFNNNLAVRSGDHETALYR